MPCRLVYFHWYETFDFGLFVIFCVVFMFIAVSVEHDEDMKLCVKSCYEKSLL